MAGFEGWACPDWNSQMNFGLGKPGTLDVQSWLLGYSMAGTLGFCGLGDFLKDWAGKVCNQHRREG
jgi:hypothetical protein